MSPVRGASHLPGPYPRARRVLLRGHRLRRGPLSGESGAETNRRAFNVRTPDEAFAAAGHPEAQVSGEDDGRGGRFAVLVFYPPWEEEHGCGVVVRDGEPVGWGEASVYVGDFDEADS